MQLDLSLKLSAAACLVRMLAAVLGLVLGLIASASYAEERIKFGWVMARSMVLDENGQPILVEYNEQGDEIKVLQLPESFTGSVDSLEVFSVRDYREQQQKLIRFKVDQPALAAGAQLLSREEAVTTALTMANGTTQIKLSDSNLKTSTRSLLVLGQADRLLNDADAIILQQYPFDLTQANIVPGNSKSILVNDLGQVIASSPYVIAPRVGFHGTPGEASKSPLGFDPEKDEIFGPVVGIPVDMGELLYPGAKGATDEDGKYVLRYRLLTCPPGGFEFMTDVWAQLKYQNFSPLGSASLPYYLRGRSWDYCYAYIDPFTKDLIQQPAVQPAQRINLYVDVMFLTGQLQMENAGDGSSVPLGDVTRSQAFDASTNAAATASDWYDFDNDGQADRPVIGRMADIPDDGTADLVFVEDDTGDLQGIYLSSNDKAEAPAESGTAPAPDLIRLLDEDRTRRLNENTGLLSSISRDDLQNTDVLVFRAATGQLVLERKGLGHAEVRAGELAVNEEGVAGYRLMLRGPADSAANVGAINRTSSFEEWATGYQLTEPFQKRESFHLQPGEWVEVVAINRSTGYMGTSRVQLKSVGDTGSTGLSVTLEPIVMRPPNLKVWAERMYNVEQGLQAGESRSGQIVSAEGASLLSDQSVRVFTEWLDHDGSPLPEGLSAVDGAQYGLTGRLAKVVAPNVVATTSSSNIAAFPIAPGRQTQILQWKDTQALAEHYYIQVIGQAKNQECAQCASFDKSGADADADAPLDTRPQYITPFLVPQYDEQKGWLAYREYRRLLKAGQEATAAGTPGDTAAPNRPLPSYAWTYRPEYQFSRFSLEVDAINRVKITDPLTGSEDKDDILDATSPVITSSDKLIEVLYSLIGPEFGRIAPIDGGQDLVLALGEHETRVTKGEDQTLRIDNIEHLASLDPEDFLTMRLYLNQDAGNVLWEYAFEHLVLGTQLAAYDASSGETLYVSADDPRVPLEAVLVGYAGRTDKTPIKVRWKATGGATLTQEYAIDHTYGIFANEITLPPNRGAISNVSVELLDAGGATATLPPIEVLAGEPTTIEVDQPNLIVSAAEANDTTLNILVKDKHGNPVAADTGVSFFVADSLHVVSTTGATDDAGKASLTFRGGSIAEMASIKINAGQVSTTVPVEVKPLKIEFVDAEATLFAGATESFTVRVTNYLDQPVNGVTVALGSSYGFLSQTEVTTNASGEASATITAPGSDGSGELTAQAGRSPWQVQPFEVVYPQQELRDLEVDHAMMVGDTSTAGVIDHVRYDSTAIALPFKTSATIKALGQPGDAVTVKIGDFRDPNLAPLAAYYLNELDGQLVLDETGRYPLSAQFVTQARGTPMGGGRSLRFSSVNQTIDGEVPSVLWTDSAPALKRLNSIGFSIDLKPTERDSAMVSGTVVDLGNGAQTLQLQSDGTLVYRVRTDTGNYIVRSAPVGVNQWHRVAARYHNGQAELWVDGTLTQMPASGVLTYSDSGRTLEVGKGFEGQLNSLKWFDWSSAPVMTFADGSTQTTVTVGPDNFTDLTLQSTGAMGAGNSLLTTMRVAVHTDQVRQYASLVSQAGFAVLAGQYADTLDPNAPPINVAGLTPTYSMLGVAQYVPPRPVQIPFISQAHAADGESNFALGLISWILPIEDFGIVIVQLGYLVSDPEKFDGLEFSIAAVNVITIFPPAKPLKVITTPLRALLRKLNDVNPKFAKYFAGYLGKVVQRSKTGDFSLLWNSLPFLALAVELYEDEDSRKGLEFMFSTINSADDVVSWVDYLALPANGWEGEGEPPTVPAFADGAPATALHNLPLNWLMPQAHAAPMAGVTRISKSVLGNALVHASAHIGKESLEGMADALKVFNRSLRKASARDMRRYAFSPELLGIAGGAMLRRAGVKTFEAVFSNAKNTRYHIAALLPMLAYLEYENTCGRVLQEETKMPEGTTPPQLESDRLKCGGKGFDNNIRNLVYRKMATAFIDKGNKDLSEEDPKKSERILIFASGHGALFHLEQLAYHQALYRVGKGYKMKASEAFRYVAFFENEDATPNAPAIQLLQGEVFKRERYVDIVLEDSEKKEIWIELKSYAAKSKIKITEPDFGKIGRWHLAKKDSNAPKGTYPSLHRQFVIDRTAKKLGGAWLAKNQSENKDIDVLVAVSNFEWRFQKFKVENRRKKPTTFVYSLDPGAPNVAGTARALLAQLPEVSAGQTAMVKTSVGTSSLTNMDAYVVESGIQTTLKTLLPQLGYSLITQAVEDIVLEE